MTRVKILCLHKITNEKSPSWPGISTNTFEKLLKHITRRYNVCLPKDVIAISDRPQIILSFDDGFEDFYLNAYPLLKKYDIPAVLNIVVDCLNTNFEIWTQALNDILDTYARANKSFYIDIMDKSYSFDINIRNAESVALEVYRKLLPLNQDTRFSLIESLKIGAPGHIIQTSMMNENQLKEVSENNIEIGSHSLTHTNIKELGENNQILEKEICESKSKLESIISKEVNIFAFPNGMYSDYAVDIAIKKGFKYLMLVNDKIANFKLNGETEILDRILIYSNQHWKNRIKYNTLYQKVKND